nr:ribonuclease H-like domain-containing protein [Tanacetum cinerariifolium]
VHPHVNKDIGIVDSGCSRSMTGNKKKLDDFMQVKGGNVTFGGGDGKITGKGTIRTSKLNFENVYSVEELQHFNLFSVSQICNKKNKVLFTDDQCLVLTKEFQLPDESQQKVEETLNLRYLEDKPNVQGLGQEWYFDLDCLTDSLAYTRFKITTLAGPKANEVSATMENHLDYAKELDRLQIQAHEAHSTAKKYGFEFSNATAEMLHQAEIETRWNLVLTAEDPAGSIISTGGVPAGSIPTSSVPSSSVPASSIPASSVPAGGVLSGSVDSAIFGDPATSESVPAVFNPDYDDNSTLSLGHSLGSSAHSTRFPSQSDLGNHQPKA